MGFMGLLAVVFFVKQEPSNMGENLDHNQNPFGCQNVRGATFLDI